jgi:hypothetical protein
MVLTLMMRQLSYIGGELSISKFWSVLVTVVCWSLVLTAQDASTADWQQVDADGLFMFRLPPGFVKRDIPVGETAVAEYYKGATRLTFIWRPTAPVAFTERRQNWMKDYEESISRIRGKRANIRTYWQNTNGERVYHAELNVGNWERGELELYMRVESPDQSSLRVASEIFKSITFPNPIPERPNAVFAGPRSLTPRQ